MYSIVIQLGAIACLPVYFWSRIGAFLSTYPKGERGDRTPLTHPLGLTAVAFVITAIPSFLLTKVIGKNLEKPLDHRVVSSDRRGVMWIVDAMNAKSEAAGPSGAGGRIHTWKMEDMSLGQAAWIGFCQIFSGVFPGTSRSMSTIAGGQLAGMSTSVGARVFFFSFDADDGRCDLIHLVQIGVGEGRKSDRSLANLSASVGRAGNRIRGVLHSCVRFRCVVFGVGKETWICAVRHLSNYRGGGGVAVGVRISADDGFWAHKRKNRLRLATKSLLY